MSDQTSPGGTPADNTTPGGNATPPPGPVADKTPPIVKLLLTKQKLLKALRTGYLGNFRTSEPGSAVLELFAEGKDAKLAAGKRKRVARGSAQFASAGKKRAVGKFTKAAKNKFKQRKKLRLLLVLTVRDVAGNATKKTAHIVLKR